MKNIDNQLGNQLSYKLNNELQNLHNLLSNQIYNQLRNKPDGVLIFEIRERLDNMLNVKLNCQLVPNPLQR